MFESSEAPVAHAVAVAARGTDQAPEDAPLPKVAPVRLHMPVDVRSLSLAVIAVLASLYALHVASAVFVPVMLGVLLSYALAPLVDRLERLRLPRVLGSALTMIAIVGGLAWSAYALSDEASNWVESLPHTAASLRRAMRAAPPTDKVQKVQQAAAQLQQAAEDAAAVRDTHRDVMRVEVVPPKFNLRDYLWTGTMGLLAVIGQLLVVCMVAYFLLAAGDDFRRKIVRMAGPTISKRRITVQALDEIATQIERYLLVQLLVSVVAGVVTGLAFAALGLEHAAIWGFVAGAGNLVPYVGSVALVAGPALAGFVQFGSLEQALLLAGVSFAVHAVCSYAITPWLTCKTSKLNAVVVFVGLLAWGWLWGVWGLLLGVPILMMIKVICDHVDDLKHIGELLG
ncbi:MAG: AI-2E family transporter [Proteobacteria bacterium]|nr:AI-2E family transporter [Pseudomonadota bacterium]